MKVALSLGRSTWSHWSWGEIFLRPLSEVDSQYSLLFVFMFNYTHYFLIS